MIDLGGLTKSREQREHNEQNRRVNMVAKKMMEKLLEEPLQFNEAMGVIDVMRQTLAHWGSSWLNGKYLNHIKQDLENDGKKI